MCSFAQMTESVSVQEDLNNPLGLAHAAKKIEDATKLYEEGKLIESERILKEVSEWLNLATQYHYDLYKIFDKETKTDLRSKLERAHALDFGQLRDKSYFLLAKILIKQNKLQDAVKILIDIIKSQISSELGLDAYKTLKEIKFSDKVN